MGSLARYTMRTAAKLQGADPAAILASLNAALLMDQTATASCRCAPRVYGEIDTSADRPACTLAVAGHPPAADRARRRQRRVDVAHGTMLGAVASRRSRRATFDLRPGDALVVYSDGILDAELGA